MKKAAFRQVRCGKYGYQIVIFDPADEDLVVQPRVTFERGQTRWIVDKPDGSGAGVSLHRAVAMRHVKPPSPGHNFVGFRNGNSNDCRASNLYWATKSELVRASVAFLEKMALAPVSSAAPA